VTAQDAAALRRRASAGPRRIAVAGAGARAQNHLAAIARLPPFWRLAGVSDVRAERADAAGQQFGAPAFENPVRMLDETQPDALFVVVPPDGHHPLTLAAAERGIHVICEVPISISLPLADLMIGACRRHGVVLEVVENVVRRPVERLRQEVVRRGLLGQPTVARMTYTSGSYHGIAAACAALGEAGDRLPAQVWGWRLDLPMPLNVDFTLLEKRTHDWESGVFRWDDGPTLLYEQPPRPGARNSWEVSGARGRTVGDEVTLLESDGARLSERRLAMRRELTTRDGVEVLARMTLPSEPAVSWENPYADLGLPGTPDEDGLLVDCAQLVDFYRSIVQDAPAGYGAHRARRDLELLLALRQSARGGSAPVRLPLDDVTDHERALHETYRQTYGHDPIEEWQQALGQLYPRGGITHGVVGGTP
jgi:predicted dehydrogenase